MHNIYFTTEAAYEAVKEELWSNGAKYPRPLIVDVIETGKVYFDDNEEHFGTVNATVTDGTVKATVNGAEVALPYKGSVGEAVVLEVIPDDGKKFDKWSDGNMDNPRTVIIVEADKMFEAECVEDVAMYLTIEGALDEDGETWMNVLQFVGNSGYPIQSVIGAGLEYSTEDVPTTWQDFPTERLWEDEPYVGLHFDASDIPSKIHLRAKDGGNTNVWGLTVEAQKVSGPILSLLDNTLSLTELPEKAFFHEEPEWFSAGLFSNSSFGSSCFFDASGIIFPDIDTVPDYAYKDMFNEVPVKKIPSILPSKHVGRCAYQNMFAVTHLCEEGGEITIAAENFYSPMDEPDYCEYIGGDMFGWVEGDNRFDVHVHTCKDPWGGDMDAEAIANALGIMDYTKVYAVDENGHEGQGGMA